MTAIRIWTDNRTNPERVESIAEILNRQEDIVALRTNDWTLFIAADNNRAMKYAQQIVYSGLRGEYCTEYIK